MIVLAATAQAAGEDYTTIPEALVNTVIAMGTVFLVLILISFIISLLKYIPALMDNLQRKKNRYNQFHRHSRHRHQSLLYRHRQHLLTIHS